MKILSSQVYVGPNIYALFPVIRLTVDLEALEEWPTERLGPAFVDKLLETLPGLHEHGCSYGERGGFIRRLHEGEGTWMGHVLEHVAIELQNIAGTPVTFGKTRGTGEPRTYDVVYEYEQAEVGHRGEGQSERGDDKCGATHGMCEDLDGKVWRVNRGHFPRGAGLAISAWSAVR